MASLFAVSRSPIGVEPTKRRTRPRSKKVSAAPVYTTRPSVATTTASLRIQTIPPRARKAADVAIQRRVHLEYDTKRSFAFFVHDKIMAPSSTARTSQMRYIRPQRRDWTLCACDQTPPLHPIDRRDRQKQPCPYCFFSVAPQTLQAPPLTVGYLVVRGGVTTRPPSCRLRAGTSALASGREPGPSCV